MLTHRGLRNWVWRFERRFPVWWILAVSLVAWALLVFPQTADVHVRHGRAGALTGLEVGHHIVMAVATMLPFAIGPATFACRTSLWCRRYRAGGLVVFGFFMIAAPAHVVLAAAARFADEIPHALVLGVAAALTCAWAISPYRRARVRRCGRTASLAPNGSRADTDCVRYGLSQGLACVVACWAFMAVGALAPHDARILVSIFALQLLARAPRAADTARAISSITLERALQRYSLTLT